MHCEEFKRARIHKIVSKGPIFSFHLHQLQTDGNIVSCIYHPIILTYIQELHYYISVTLNYHPVASSNYVSVGTFGLY
jgi:hypothetical protein